MKLPFFTLVMNFTVYFTLIAYLSAVFWLYYHLLKRYGEKSTKPALPMVIGFGAPIIVVLLSSGKTVSFHIPPAVATGSAVLMLVTVALVMFAIKIHALRIYAVMELLFAIAVLAQTIGTVSKDADTAQTLALMAGVYLLIRGLDNFKKDMDARRLAA